MSTHPELVMTVGLPQPPDATQAQKDLAKAIVLEMIGVADHIRNNYCAMGGRDKEIIAAKIGGVIENICELRQRDKIKNLIEYVLKQFLEPLD